MRKGWKCQPETVGLEQSRRFLKCIDGNFLTRVTEDPINGRHCAGPYTYKQPSGDVQVRGSMDCTDHEMADGLFSKNLDHDYPKEQALASSGISLEEACEIQPWTKKESKKGGWFSRTTSCELQNGPSQYAGSQAQTAGGPHGWTRSSWLNSNMKRKCTRDGSRVR